MENIEYRQIYEHNHDLYQDLLPQWIDYMKWLDEQDDLTTSNDEFIHDLNRRVKQQGSRNDMHFELCYVDGKFVGFSHYAIIKDTDKGYLMEMYISPEYRRKGYGRKFYNHIEQTLKCEGANQISLTTDTDTGMSFWTSVGFCDTGEIDPDNNMSIYIKQLS